MTGDYPFDDAWAHERERLGSLARPLEPGTQRHLRAVGVGAGWRCLEVGAGDGSVARWLCDEVGPSGHVVAADIQTAFLHALAHPTLEVRRHDIAVDEIPDGGFDLVHARWVLHWVPRRTEALRRMVAALGLGGRLVVEEPDIATLVENAEPAVFRTVVTATMRWLEESTGVDPRCGRKLLAELSAQDLVDVQAEGRVHMLRGADAASGAGWLAGTIEKVRPGIVASRTVTDAAVDDAVGLLGDPGFTALFPVTMAAWGRRPGE